MVRAWPPLAALTTPAAWINSSWHAILRCSIPCPRSSQPPPRPRLCRLCAPPQPLPPAGRARDAGGGRGRRRRRRGGRLGRRPRGGVLGRGGLLQVRERGSRGGRACDGRGETCLGDWKGGWEAGVAHLRRRGGTRPPSRRARGERGRSQRFRSTIERGGGVRRVERGDGVGRTGTGRPNPPPDDGAAPPASGRAPRALGALAVRGRTGRGGRGARGGGRARRATEPGAPGGGSTGGEETGCGGGGSRRWGARGC
jgi:hypothetical protein